MDFFKYGSFPASSRVNFEEKFFTIGNEQTMLAKGKIGKEIEATLINHYLLIIKFPDAQREEIKGI